MSINQSVMQFLNQNGIEYVSVLDISDCEIIQPHLMPKGVNSAFFWLIPYYTGKHENRNVSLYSVSRDYHLFSKQLAAQMKSELCGEYPDSEFFFFCDSSPINEVAAAVKSGLGVIGKNRLLINEKYGSYVFIGSMLTSEIASVTVFADSGKTCLGCGRCEKACDFLGGKCDVCYSELNQRKVVSDAELALIRSKKLRWGCDTCQEVCPMNSDVQCTPIRFFHEKQIEVVTPELLDSMTKQEFSERAYAWRGKKTIYRNVQ